MPPDLTGMIAENILALLEADRIHDALALETLQPRLDHAPLRAVNHDRNPRQIGLGSDQVQEAGHAGLPIQHSFVEIHIDHR
ncbi:MAG: hypothetical protein BWY82_01205 [Verrucomicrobia bacterium ADurb.Bin474]|nr:MAG: hypothetical protein BWY82_01205 [Verrucomicrobia bacterium ADurb.Bin474]